MLATAVAVVVPAVALGSNRHDLPSWMEQMMGQAPPEMQQMMQTPPMRRMMDNPPPEMQQMMDGGH